MNSQEKKASVRNKKNLRKFQNRVKNREKHFKFALDNLFFRKSRSVIAIMIVPKIGIYYGSKLHIPPHIRIWQFKNIII